MRILFFGTSNFAVSSLEYILASNHEVVGVVTSVDKPAGRYLSIKYSEIKSYALTKNIPILQPNNLKDKDFLETLKSFKADIFVIVAFRILPEIVWNMPPRGSINLHASLLPYYRGAAPINWVIINGETQTGVTTFQLKQKVDTGNIYLQKKVAIPAKMNATQLHDTLKIIGAKLLVETLDKIEDNSIESKQQNISTTNPKIAPKLTPQLCQLDFSQSCIDLHNLIRGLSEYPCAFTFLPDNSRIKIFSSNYSEEPTHTFSNKIQSDLKTYLGYVCKNGILYIQELQIAGKQKMSISEFLNGYRKKIEPFV